MKSPPNKEQAEQKVLQKYAKLHTALMEVVDALQYLEPIGTFVDQAEFKKVAGKMSVQYKARPVQLVIEDENKRFILRVEQIN